MIELAENGIIFREMLPTRENCYRHVAHHTTLGKSPAGRNFQPAFVIYYGIVYHVIKTKRSPDIIT